MPSVPPPADPRLAGPEGRGGGARDEDGSRLVRVGSGIGASVIATGAAVLPATLRMSGNVDASALQVWSALVAIEILPMVIAVLVLREARVGLRAFAGPDAGVKAVGVVVWLLSLFAFLVPLGVVLHPRHQHSLMGVTYAFGGVAAALGLAVVVGRLTRIVCAFSPAGRRVAVIATVAFILVAVIAATFRLSRSPDVPPAIGSGLVDVLALALGALFASRPLFADRPRLAVIGPPVAAILVVIGVSALRGSAGIGPALADHAPAFDPIAALVGTR